MADLFISYTHEDRPVAAALAAQLIGLGIDVWWDHELLGGDDYRARISEILARISAAIVIWSRRSVQSQWVLNEAATASERRCLIPVRVDDERPPIDFRSLHTIDLSAWLPGDALPAELVRALSERLGRQIDYDPVATRAGTVARLAHRATAAWYLDFEEVLFYLIGLRLACYLLALPLPGLTRRLVTNAPAMVWAPYAVALANGLIVAAITCVRYWHRRLPVAAAIFAGAAILSMFAYAIADAVTTALSADELQIITAFDVFLFIVTTAIADRCGRQR